MEGVAGVNVEVAKGGGGGKRKTRQQERAGKYGKSAGNSEGAKVGGKPDIKEKGEKR